MKVPIDQPHEKAVYHTFVIQAEQRDELKEHLAEKGIETAIHYPVPIHLHKTAASLGYKPGSFPVTERQASQILSLPVYPELRPMELEYIVQTIREFYAC
jgi:dTDP-4-amino-4,6-dideoxygalactose transaminase